MSEPWGHKITLTVYLEGRPADTEQIANAADAMCSTLEWFGLVVDFAGAATEEVAERPVDQGAV